MSKTRKEILGFDDKWLIILGIPIVAVMVNAILFGKATLHGGLSFFGICQLIALAYTTIFWLLFREGHFILLKRYPHPGHTGKRFVATVAMTIIGYILINFMMDTLMKPYFPKDIEPGPTVKVVTTFLFITLILGTYEGLHLSNRLKQSILEREKLIKENINSQLEGLRSQVNPHFLFNSLNTLASIIPEDAEKGVNFVTKLAKVYRYMLESRNEKLIPIREELEFLNAYIYLLKQRFGDNIQINIQLNEQSKEKMIIPLSLQITFENAIKHNVISKEKPLLIEVFVDDNEKLVVKNTLQKKKVLNSSTKVGLQNIKNRYAFYTNKTVDIVTTHEYFSVMLPIIAQNKTLTAHA